MKLLEAAEITAVVTSIDKLVHARSRHIMQERALGPLEIYPAYEHYRSIQKSIPTCDFVAIVDTTYLTTLITAFGCAVIVYSELSVQERVSFLLPAQVQAPMIVAETSMLLTGLIVSTTHRNGVAPEYFEASAQNCFEVYSTLCAVE